MDSSPIGILSSAHALAQIGTISGGSKTSTSSSTVVRGPVNISQTAPPHAQHTPIIHHKPTEALQHGTVVPEAQISAIGTWTTAQPNSSLSEMTEDRIFTMVANLISDSSVKILQDDRCTY